MKQIFFIVLLLSIAAFAQTTREIYQMRANQDFGCASYQRHGDCTL